MSAANYVSWAHKHCTLISEDSLADALAPVGHPWLSNLRYVVYTCGCVRTVPVAGHHSCSPSFLSPDLQVATLSQPLQVNSSLLAQALQL